MKTIAILGGTFDPIHNGHICVAESVVSEMGVDFLTLIPTGDPPHKQCFEPSRHRLAMAKLGAEAGNGRIIVSDVEATRSGTTYTVDTLAAIKASSPDAGLRYIIGGDALLLIETWRDFPKVAKLLSGLIVAIRPGTDEADTVLHMAALRRKYGLSAELLNVHGPDISSTEIRGAIVTGEDFSELVPRTVKAYIDETGLYLDPVRRALKADLTPQRFEHVLGTETAAAWLAAKYGADISVSRLAALLHDCAKDLTLEAMQSLTANRDLSLEDIEISSRQLLHGPAGSVLARENFGVLNEDILSAIHWHTTGKRGMGLLAKIIYVADAIEHTREGIHGLDAIREAASRDLDEAVYEIAVWKHRHVLKRGYTPSAHTLDLLKKDMEDMQ